MSFCHSSSVFALRWQFMRTNIPDIFSAGDVTAFPLAIRGDQRCNIGHWQMSQAQGRRHDKQQDPLNVHFCNVWSVTKPYILCLLISHRAGRCPQHAAETDKNWVCPLFLDGVSWEKHQIHWYYYFFNSQFNIYTWFYNIRYSFFFLGYGEGFTEIIYKGKIEERKFLAFFIK